MNMTSLCRHILLLGVVAVMSSPVQARVLGTFGQTYSIAEPDALKEIEERARTLDWPSLVKKVKPEEFRPANLVPLPRANRPRSFLVDMTYTLEFDVPDGHGGVLYPSGYRFNPLDYVPFNQTLVVLDGNDPEQVAWLKGSSFLNRPDTLILLTRGDFSELGRAIGKSVFYADKRILERFNLAAVPSIISRKDRLMEVTEIEIPDHSAHR